MNEMELNTYVLTGATSFIGTNLARRLLAAGKRVYAICRPDSRNIQNLPKHKNLTLVNLDFDNIERLTEFIAEADVFVNLAWKGTTHEQRNNDEINRSNVGNTLKAMRVAKKIGCRLFVESGSQAEYGYMEGITDENAECKPFSAYGKAKLETLRECSRLASELGIGYLHLRIFSVYGGGDHQYTLFKTCLSKMVKNEPISLTECSQMWNFLYIGDAVAIIDELIKKLTPVLASGKTEVVNVASKDTRQLRDFVVEMKTLLDSESKLNFGEVKVDRLLSIMPSTEKLTSILDKDFKFKSFREGVDASLIYNTINLIIKNEDDKAI